MSEIDFYISIKEPVANAKAQLNISYSTEDEYLIMMAAEAESQILSKHTLVKKVAPIDINNYTAELPTDLHTLIAIRMTEGSEVIYPRFAKKSFFKYSADCLNTIETHLPYTCSIEDYTVYFSTDITADECEISYYGLNLDESGLPKIHRDHEVAIVNYICWRYCMRFFDMFPERITEMYRMKWEQKCMQARARGNKIDPIESNYNKLIWNNMLRPHRHTF